MAIDPNFIPLIEAILPDVSAIERAKVPKKPETLGTDMPNSPESSKAEIAVPTITIATTGDI